MSLSEIIDGYKGAHQIIEKYSSRENRELIGAELRDLEKRTDESKKYNLGVLLYFIRHPFRSGILSKVKKDSDCRH